MSVSSCLTVKVHSHFDAFSLFLAVSKAGWTPIVDRKITFLPLSDGDSYAWKSITEQDISLAFAEIRQKGALNEVIGIAMTYRDSDCGGDFHFKPDGEIAISLSINRKTIPGLDRVTALEWYVQVLYNTFEEIGVVIVSLLWEETH